MNRVSTAAIYGLSAIVGLLAFAYLIPRGHQKRMGCRPGTLLR
jgi:hypothetical protein